MKNKECEKGNHVPSVITDNHYRPFEVICIDCGTPMTKDNYLSFFGDKASDIVKWDEEADPQDLTWFSDSDGNLVGYKTVI